MKSLIVVCCVLLALSFAAPIPITSGSVVHVVIPKDSDRVLYQWTGDADAVAYGAACYGDVDVYYGRDESITPETGTYHSSYNSQHYLHTRSTFPKNRYILFVAKDKTNAGPGGINGALDLAFSTSEAETKAMIPNVFDGKITFGDASKTIILTWKATGSDNITVYRKDILRKDYNQEKDFPPPGYYQTGCSAKYWLSYDDDATKTVNYKHPDEEYTGVCTVKGLKSDTATIIALLSEMKTQNPFTNNYKFIVVGSASSSVISVVALLFLLISVLLI